MPVRVVEVTAERGADDPPEIPWDLAGPPGSIHLQLRSTLRRVAAGAGMARRPALLEAVRAIPGVDSLVVSPAGGTFIVGGPAWLGLCAIGVPPPGQPMPLDWMLGGLLGWVSAGLGPLGLEARLGRVDGAWCPGFSDLAVGGRKLAGLGFRMTRDRVAMRGVLAVAAIDDWDLRVLQATHRLIDLEVRPDAITSLAEATGDPGWTVPRALETFHRVAVP